jgi:hypothetical protein
MLYKPDSNFDLQYVESHSLNALAREIKQEVGCNTSVFVDPVSEGDLFAY